MSKRKNIGQHYIDICSVCDKEIPYEDIRNRTTICPYCGSKMIITDDKCYEVTKLLKEINLKPLSVGITWNLDKDVVGKIDISIKLGVPCDEAMFSDLPNFKFSNIKTLKLSSYTKYINDHNIFYNLSVLICSLDYIPNETVGDKHLGSSDILKILDSRIKDLKDWCEDYKENLEGRQAVGILAGWFDL